MAKFTASKYKNTNAAVGPRETWYENLRTSNLVTDGPMLHANHQFFAYIDDSGSGSVLSPLPLASVGKHHIPVTSTAYQQPVIRAHTSSIQDFKFNPFNPNQLASCSLDGNLKLWTLPDGGLVFSPSFYHHHLITIFVTLD